jgi:sucrose phosphorylase
MTPDTVAFLADITAEAHSLGVEVLTEIHAHWQHTVQTARRVDRVYDFVLAPLILHALFTGGSGPLRSWLYRRPPNSVTVLDTHDGIGMIDAGTSAEGGGPGMLSPGQIAALVERISVSSGGTSRSSTARGAAAGGVYQVSCTAYDAVGRDDRCYLLARLLQLFTPGIPQVYYVGLLAGRNQPELIARTGDAREINRRRYTPSEVDIALRQPVVRALTRLIRLRNAHSAFDGEFAVPDGPPGEIAMLWRNGDERAELRCRLADASYRVTVTAEGREREVTDVAEL